MAALIESESVTPLAPRRCEDLATLAEDMQRLPIRSEGFTVEEYFSLDGNYLVEYVDGYLQILPMPDLFHQNIVRMAVFVHQKLLGVA